MLLSDLLCDFLGYCKVERGMTKTTLVTYGSGLRHFLRWTVEQGEPAATHLDFNTDLLRRYQYSVSATGVRPRTVRSKIIALRSWGHLPGPKGDHHGELRPLPHDAQEGRAAQGQRIR